MTRSKCLVIGSANMDLVVTTGNFPRPGETVLGTGFATIPGGKGANQAVCCAKLGGRVEFVGKLGNDRFRDQLRESMLSEGVSLRHTMTASGVPTGIAVITVDGSGQNEIVVVSGANMHLKPRDIDAHRGVMAQARVLLLQLEIPLSTVSRAASRARRQGVRVILNPAPARQLPDTLLRCIDYLTPNETEAGQLSGVNVTNRSTGEKAARRLLSRGVGNVILTMGAGGCLHVTPSGATRYPARKVRVVDTTAAGDAFNGALGYALASGWNIEDALPFANDVAALSVTRFGAQSSMPTRRDVDRFRRRGAARSA